MPTWKLHLAKLLLVPKCFISLMKFGHYLTMAGPDAGLGNRHVQTALMAMNEPHMRDRSAILARLEKRAGRRVEARDFVRYAQSLRRIERGEIPLDPQD